MGLKILSLLIMASKNSCFANQVIAYDDESVSFEFFLVQLLLNTNSIDFD